MDKNYDISFLDENRINEILESSKEKSKNKEEIRNIIEKAKKAEGLSPVEAAALLNIDDSELLKEMFEAAHIVKEKIYGKELLCLHLFM